jgi:hypothetical protein
VGLEAVDQLGAGQAQQAGRGGLVALGQPHRAADHRHLHFFQRGGAGAVLAVQQGAHAAGRRVGQAGAIACRRQVLGQVGLLAQRAVAVQAVPFGGGLLATDEEVGGVDGAAIGGSTTRSTRFSSSRMLPGQAWPAWRPPRGR